MDYNLNIFGIEEVVCWLSFGVVLQLINTAAGLQAIAMSLGAAKEKSSDSINHNGINKSLDSKVEEATANDRVINTAP